MKAKEFAIVGVLLVAVISGGYFAVTKWLNSGKATKTGYDIRTHSAAAESLAARSSRKTADIDTVSTELDWVRQTCGLYSIRLLEAEFQRYDVLSVKVADSLNTPLRINRRRTAGLNLAASLLRQFDRRWIDRTEHSNMIQINNSVAIIDTVVSILRSIHAEPQDIVLSKPVTPDSLHAVLRRDLRDGVQQIRSSLPPNSSDDTMESQYGYIFKLITLAIRDYSFKLEDFGLTEAEISIYTSLNPVREQLLHRNKPAAHADEPEEPDETDE